MKIKTQTGKPKLFTHFNYPGKSSKAIIILCKELNSKFQKCNAWCRKERNYRIKHGTLLLSDYMCASGIIKHCLFSVHTNLLMYLSCRSNIKMAYTKYVPREPHASCLETFISANILTLPRFNLRGERQSSLKAALWRNCLR